MSYRVEGAGGLRIEVVLNTPAGPVDLAQRPDNLLRLNILERAGMDFPHLSMMIRTTNQGEPSLPRLFNEGNLLSVSFDDDSGLSDTAEFILQQPNLIPSGTDSWIMYVTGLKSTLPQWSKPGVKITEEMSGVESLAAVAQNAGESVLNRVRQSKDKQRWIQYGQPAKRFAEECWLHSELEGSFPLVANAIGPFIIDDMRSIVGRSPEYVFSNTDPDGLEYHWASGIEQQAGFFASIGGRGQEQLVWDLTKGEPSMEESSPEQMLALSPGELSSEFSKISAERRTLTRNMHDKYWQSYIHNTTQLALYSSVRYVLVFSDYFLPIRPLELVMLKEPNIGTDGVETAEPFSGLYVVSKVARLTQGNIFKTAVQIVRESWNSNVGSNLV